MKLVNDNKKFLKKLGEEQIRELIYLGLLNCDNENGERYVINSTVDDIVITYQPVEKWDLRTFVFIDSSIYQHQQVGVGIPFKPYFLLDDYSMTITDGYFRKDISSVLHVYLTSKFGDEYVEYRYQKYIDNVNENRKCFLENSHNLSQKIEFNQKKKVKLFK